MALRSQAFIVSYVVMFFSIMYCTYISIEIKSFGMANGLSDAFITIALVVGLCFNCFSRMLTGFILERINFKVYYTGLLFGALICAATYDLIVSIKSLFTLYLCGTYFISGAIYVSMPIYYASVFGSDVGSEAYTYFFTANSSS